MHPIGLVRVRHFEFVCRSMHIEPTVNRFQVFHQMHCSQGFYSSVQRASFFFINVGVIPMKMTFKGKEDVATKNTQTPFSEGWYQDLKDVPSTELPKKALVGAGMSLLWRMDRE
ncbi:hypothetical protein Hanom_Chr12g01138791 [Helianthus anomalus]